MPATISISIAGPIDGQTRTVSRTLTIRDVNLARMLACYRTVYPEAALERDVFGAWADGLIQGTVANVRRHAADAARSAVTEPTID